MSLLWLHFGESGCFAAALVLLFLFGMDSKVYILRRNILSLKICLKIDILYACRTKIHKAKNMIDILIIILPTIWVSFAAYLLWYATSAKRNVSITFDDAKTLWQIHKKTANCSGHKWNPISRKGGKISGFQCECGYKYTQKRPLLSTIPRPKKSNRDNRSQTGFPVASY
jgi:hypothetical protein